MPSDKQQKSNASGKSSASSNANGNDTNESPLNGSGTPQSVCEVERLNMSTSGSLNRRISIDSIALGKICTKYKIQSEMGEHLRQLRNVEIVIVIDDSGSMITTVDGTQRTRWDELRAIVKVVIEIGVIFDSNGIDIYFINGRTFHKVKDPQVVDEAFATPPSGYTPLVPTLKKIFMSDLARRGRDKKLLVFVATDGEPTDDDGNPEVDKLKRLMQETRKVDTTYVSFLLCTDEPDCVNYLNEWDLTMQNVDVTDDYENEKKKIRKYRGQDYPFSNGDYIVKAMVGATIRHIDRVNEPE